MATVYGVNRTKMLTPTGSNILDQGINKGNLCFMYETYELSLHAAADVIEVCDKIPDGAVVTKITVLLDDEAGTATADIGDQDDDDRYGSAIDFSGQALTYVFPEQATAGNIAGYGYQVIAGTSDQIQILLNASTNAGTIKIGVEYSV